MGLGTTRATKKPFLIDTANGGMFQFQFAPHELEAAEGGNFSTVNKVGSFFSDLIWISGNVSPIKFRVFIDVTQESSTDSQLFGTKDPFEDVQRFPNSNPSITGTGAEALIRGLAAKTQGNSISARLGYDPKEKNMYGGQLMASIYSANPDFRVGSFIPANTGVYSHLEQLMYFVRPQGMQLPTATVSQRGIVTVTDVAQGRFTPPPMCRFFYGSMWKEGYILQVNYNLSVMNNLLVPQRMDAEVIFGITKYGYLNDIMGGGTVKTIS